jgi:glycosyltransferase involved in cell wall biosynthesis
MVTLSPIGASTHEGEGSVGTAIESVPLGVSVCIPCFNSSARLPETLWHLQKQRIPEGLNWEVIVIDNNSTDDTAAAAKRLWADFCGAPIRVIHEPRVGASHARARALLEGRYEFIAFVDDDNWVCEDFVALVYEVMAAHPEVGACGGRGSPVFESGMVPDWFWRFQEYYATGAQADQAGYLPTSRGAFHSAGMALRKSAWQGLLSGGFDFKLKGRKGTELSAGEDTELCYALQLAGWKLWYDPRLTFDHFITAGRLEWSYLIRMNRGSGVARCWVDIYARQLSPENHAFSHLPIPPAVAGRIRDTWLYQVYSRFRALRNLRDKSQRTSSDDPEMREVVTAHVDGYLRELLRNPFSYMLFKARLRKARWRKQQVIGSPASH